MDKGNLQPLEKVVPKPLQNNLDHFCTLCQNNVQKWASEMRKGVKE